MKKMLIAPFTATALLMGAANALAADGVAKQPMNQSDAMKKPEMSHDDMMKHGDKMSHDGMMKNGDIKQGKKMQGDKMMKKDALKQRDVMNDAKSGG